MARGVKRSRHRNGCEGFDRPSIIRVDATDLLYPNEADPREREVACFHLGGACPPLYVPRNAVFQRENEAKLRSSIVSRKTGSSHRTHAF